MAVLEDTELTGDVDIALGKCEKTASNKMERDEQPLLIH